MLLFVVLGCDCGCGCGYGGAVTYMGMLSVWVTLVMEVAVMDTFVVVRVWVLVGERGGCECDCECDAPEWLRAKIAKNPETEKRRRKQKEEEEVKEESNGERERWGKNAG